MPSNKYGNTSCFRISDLSASAVWDIAQKHVLSEKIKKIYGRFDFLAEGIFRHKLDFVPDNSPPRHANIVNWPHEKQAQKSRAQEIAAESIFHCEVLCKGYVAQVAYEKKKNCLEGVIDSSGKHIIFTSKEVNKLLEAMETALE